MTINKTHIYIFFLTFLGYKNINFQINININYN